MMLGGASASTATSRLAGSARSKSSLQDACWRLQFSNSEPCHEQSGGFFERPPRAGFHCVVACLGRPDAPNLYALPSSRYENPPRRGGAPPLGGRHACLCVHHARRRRHGASPLRSNMARARPPHRPGAERYGVAQRGNAHAGRRSRSRGRRSVRAARARASRAAPAPPQRHPSLAPAVPECRRARPSPESASASSSVPCSAESAEWGPPVWAGNLFVLSASWEDACARVEAYEVALAEVDIFFSSGSLEAMGNRFAPPPPRCTWPQGPFARLSSW